MPPRAEGLLALLALLLGAVLGSFANVVIARVPAGLSVVSPRSRCPRCLAPIAWYDNLPVLSWLLLRARCRGCRAPIAARYPLVELAVAAVALLALRRHGPSGAALAELGFSATLLALGLIDLDTWLLPNALTWPLLAGGLLCSALGATAAGSLSQAAWGAGVGFAVFALVAAAGKKLAGREAMGFGDVWLLAGLGAFLGVKALLPLVLLASLQGTVVGIGLGILGKLPKGGPSPRPSPPAGERERSLPDGEGKGKGEDEEDWTPPRNAVPFGPFLVAGALEWLYLGDRIVGWFPTLELFR